MDNTRTSTEGVNAIAETRTLVTAVKLRELYLKKKQCEEHLLPILNQIEKAATEKEKLQVLVDENADRSSRYYGAILDRSSTAPDLFSMARIDPTISDGMFEQQRIGAEEKIRRLLRKSQYASLFGSIFNEWMNFEGKVDQLDDEGDGVKTPRSDDESATNLSQGPTGRPEKQVQKAELESIIFESDPKAKPQEFLQYLEHLFRRTEGDAKKPARFSQLNLESDNEDDVVGNDAKDDDPDGDLDYQNYLSDYGTRFETVTLRKLRGTMGRFSGSFRKSVTLNVVDVKQSIHGLISGELLTEAKKAACKEILLSNVILDEIAMVLTSRLREIENWKYSEPSIQLNFRRHLNGKYRCYADESLLDAIFLQWIGVKWGIELRRVLGILHNSSLWLRPVGQINGARQEVRKVMLPREAQAHAIPIEQHEDAYMKEFFLTLLPESLYDFRAYNEDGEGADEEKKDNEKIRRARNEELKQKLLQRILIDREYSEAVSPGETFTVAQADAFRFAQSQSHEIILALMEFIGVTNHWLQFFRTFLRLPARFEPGGEVRESKRGVPISHPLGLVFGELQLFFMEFAVNRATGGTLQMFRMHDDLWWWGADERQCERAWETIQTYSALTGTNWNLDKSGCVKISSQPEQSNTKASSILPTGEISWGFIKLGTDGTWKIKQDEVEKHIKEMKLQMESQKSILGIIGAYNRYMKFFVRNFGKPCNAFGKQHVEQMISAVTKIHSSLFPSHDGNVLSYISSLIASRFGDEFSGPVLHAWLLAPVTNGGLGVRNVLFDLGPVLRAYELAEGIYERAKRTETVFEPQNFKQCLKKDRHEYELARESWLESLQSKNVAWEREFPDEWFDGMEAWLKSTSNSGSRYLRRKPHPFMTFEEFILGRRIYFGYWGDVWKGMSENPKHTERFQFPTVINTALLDCSYATNGWLKRDYSSNDPYWRSWLLSFGEGFLTAFGDFTIAQEAELPVAMIEVYTNLKTKWDQ
ncbi:hypothetical protein DRE_02901 [Drechslerella stenobrocha 248]|uniref:Reverse transcriptase domain-containing protein n=1 Tax=Drechslerella stenobrocha 248 TaxID=1043628 RepID=W7HU47_9PEZI|nr:hypothetical protein DRE_02901 [Drechslerella stenobrocha 248]